MLRNTLNTNPFHTTASTTNFEDEDDSDNIFGAAKTKTKDLNKLFANTTKPSDPSKELIMSSNTFNESALIKKKPEPVEIVEVSPAKPAVPEKKNKLLESDHEEDTFFKKKPKDPPPKTNPIQAQKKKNTLFDSE